MGMDYKLLIDSAALAGTIMLENGAEIYRVEETIDYMLRTSGLKTTQAFVVSTGFMISLDDPGIDALTVVRRVNKKSTNLNAIAQVNDISRRFYKGSISLEETFSQLKHLNRTQYPWWLKDICTVLVVTFFTGMYGGSWMDMIFTPKICQNHMSRIFLQIKYHRTGTRRRKNQIGRFVQASIF